MRGGLLAVATQVLGLALAPVLPGLIQTMKARLQGRRGPSPLQPYRELRRLWHKSAVAPTGASFVYRLAPSVCAAALICAVLVVPVGTGTVGVLGTDVLMLVGLLALARFAVTIAAWDTGGAFSLMGAGRDLMFAVFAEPLMMFSVVLVALGAHSTDLVRMVTAVSDTGVAVTVTHWCAAVAFSLVVLVETGRQPIDNPDTHLELTMVHEGPLLEYAGRDLAMLQWTAAARHWVMLVLGAGLFLPLPQEPVTGVAVLVAWVLGSCVLIAFIESSLAKLRILRVPALLGMGMSICLVGLAIWIVGGGR